MYFKPAVSPPDTMERGIFKCVIAKGCMYPGNKFPYSTGARVTVCHVTFSQRFLVGCTEGRAERGLQPPPPPCLRQRLEQSSGRLAPINTQRQASAGVSCYCTSAPVASSSDRCADSSVPQAHTGTGPYHREQHRECDSTPGCR